MADTGWGLCGTGSNVVRSGSGDNWSNPNNITYEDTLHKANSTPSDGEYSDWLTATNFGFSIPSDQQIDGIEVLIDCKANYNDRDYIVDLYLYDGSSQLGNDNGNDTYLQSSQTDLTFGGATDTWGASLTPTIVNDSGFGVQICDKNDNTFSGYPYMYYVKMKVYYSPAPVSTTPKPIINIIGI